MKAVVSLAVVGLAFVWSSAVFAEDAHESMLAEMEHCAVCKYLVEKPDLMKQMTWETHKIENGMLSVTSVPKELRDEFDVVNHKMMQAIEKVKADVLQGKKVALCDFCSSMGDMAKAGAKIEHIETATGTIHLCTSNDPALVKKIHAFADKVIATQKKLEQQRTASLP